MVDGADTSAEIVAANHHLSSILTFASIVLVLVKSVSLPFHATVPWKRVATARAGVHCSCLLLTVCERDSSQLCYPINPTQSQGGKALVDSAPVASVASPISTHERRPSDQWPSVGVACLEARLVCSGIAWQHHHCSCSGMRAAAISKHGFLGF